MGIIIQNRYNFLQNDGTAISTFIYKVYGATCKFNAIFQSLTLTVKTGEARQQCRMNVNNFIMPFIYEATAQNTHEACQNYKFATSFNESSVDFFFEFFFRSTFFTSYYNSFDTYVSSTFQSVSISFIADYNANFQRQIAVSNSIQNSLEITTATAYQYASFTITHRKLRLS